MSDKYEIFIADGTLNVLRDSDGKMFFFETTGCTGDILEMYELLHGAGLNVEIVHVGT